METKKIVIKDKYTGIELDEETLQALNALRPIAMGGLCLVSGIALIAPQLKDFLAITDPSKLASIITRAFVFMGCIDLLLSFLGFLAFRYVYSLIRLRSMLGLGYLLYSCQLLDYGNYIFPVLAIAHLCLFFSTLTHDLLSLKLFLVGGSFAFMCFAVLPYFF